MREDTHHGASRRIKAHQGTAWPKTIHANIFPVYFHKGDKVIWKWSIVAFIRKLYICIREVFQAYQKQTNSSRFIVGNYVVYPGRENFSSTSSSIHFHCRKRNPSFFAACGLCDLPICFCPGCSSACAFHSANECFAFQGRKYFPSYCIYSYSHFFYCQPRPTGLLMSQPT